MTTKRIRTLKDFREERDWSQAEAAAHFGVSQSQWSRWEAGEQRPNRRISKRLLAETRVGLDVLMGIAS